MNSPVNTKQVISPHITICICTYRRASLLERLLTSLLDLDTAGKFTYSVVVVDNDMAESARSIVDNFRNHSTFNICFGVEKEQNIALARNRAMGLATGDLIAFIDDDEFPERDWLRKLYKAMVEYKADGVFGPVRPHFDQMPPKWLIKGRFCERPEHRTGSRLDSGSCRTGNALVKSEIFTSSSEMFDPAFGRTGGEDNQFFLKQIKAGKNFVWCNEGVVHEVVPPERWRLEYYLKRQMRIGGITGELIRKKLFREDPLKYIKFIMVNTMKLAASITVLPLSGLLGKSVFFRVLLKMGYSGSVLLGWLGSVPLRYRED